TECAGSGLANTDIDNSRFMSHLLLKFYPDILENAFILHFPTIFKALWKITKGLLGSYLANKYIIPKEEEVFHYIDKDQ
ncbi:SEC14 family lipid-binding protein, partial [Salmonella sp. s54925]|uniref:SEC14 family lipid-binding protein n=1 Tax=Salmonella sp. s54925 TaxID=3159674 RepID=UPI00398011EF